MAEITASAATAWSSTGTALLLATWAAPPFATGTVLPFAGALMRGDPFIDPSQSSFAASSAARWSSFLVGQTLSAETYHAVCDDEAKTQHVVLQKVTGTVATLTMVTIAPVQGMQTVITSSGT